MVTLFRWLSKKYPKIVSRVVEDTPTKVRNEDGEVVEVPVRYESRNPNGFEVDNLYLDMNGIVHPCTHPEGKPAPETEEDMMLEIFAYTERVVNMARPRKVLMMAIDGVAPRAKMNQQRSRRFRAAQEAAEKEEERREAIKLFEAMGHPVSEATKSHKAWDSNAITPGTPFMDLLAASLRYWVSVKLTTDPGWKDLKVIISDATVPGEGEHKIVDWVRRQRNHSHWDPNTSHVIYGLDADLIMLGLATHEPHFRVLREDVFFQGSKDAQTCKNCGDTGHFAANCKGEKQVKDPNIVEVAKPVDPKPFIFLDVACLREYLSVELNVPGVPFFDLELAIDDWVFMIFFVGNDFLPHLPSLEIREGAIDALLKIWRAELPRMGGYLTNHGKVAMGRAQIILEGLAKNEDEIFQKRKEDEERQESHQKRRRIEDHRRQDADKARKEAMQMNGTDYVAVAPSATARGGDMHPSLPERPGSDAGPARPKKLTVAQQAESIKAGLDAMSGSNADIVRNRKAIRMSNKSAAELLKAELDGDGAAAAPPAADEDVKTVTLETEDEEKEQVPVEQAREILEEQGEDEGVDEEMVPPAIKSDTEDGEDAVDRPGDEVDASTLEDDDDAIEVEDGAAGVEAEAEAKLPTRGRKKRGKKRKAGERSDDEAEDDTEAPPNPEDQPVAKKKLHVNADGTVDYQDDVRLWEPGYRERYYRSKFGVELTDREFIDKITKCYMEGLCWVLEYYYQGVPAWDWYYPFHYAPFAQDFQNVDKLDIKFKAGEPFKPFAQLLGVFPAASKIHLPEPLQTLMVNEDSPILDFYPEDFDIDMNGKKMAWQGVALLPFIDQHRLLSALKSKEDELSEAEHLRNRWGDNYMLVARDNDLHESFEKLYTKNAAKEMVPLDTYLSKGVAGAVLAVEGWVPDSALETPVPSTDLGDLEHNASLPVRYFFPPRARTEPRHKSILLPGFKPPPPYLSESDKDWVRRGGDGNRRGGGRGGRPSGGGPGRSHPNDRSGRDSGRSTPSSLPRSNAYSSAPDLPRYGSGAQAGGYGGRNGQDYGRSSYSTGYAPQQGGAGYGGYGGGDSRSAYGGPAAYAAPPARSNYGGASAYGGAPSSYGGGQSSYGYGGGAPAYGAYGGGGGGGGYAANGGSAYASSGAPYAPPRNPYAPPPPQANPYAQAPNPYGGSGAYGGGGGRGAYNPYASGRGAPRR